MAKYTYTSIDSLTNESSAITQINRNFAALQTALENTLSRDGTTPNTMTANLDMNSKRIVNLAAPVGSSDAVRKIDLQDAVFGDYTPVVEDTLSVLDGVAEPSVSAGRALIYVDTVDGDLKVKFSNGTVSNLISTTTQVNLIDYGADPTGVADSADAWDSVFALAETQHVYCRVPEGTYKVTRKISVSTDYSLVIEGEGTNVTLINFTNTGTDGGFEYVGGYESSQDRPYFAMRGMSVTTYGANQTGIKASFRVIGSSQFTNFHFQEMDFNVSNVNDTGVYWNRAIWVIDGWHGVCEKITANQSINKLAGTMIAFDGLSPACRAIHCDGMFWDKAVYIGYQTVTGLKGTISGTHLYGEIVTGGTSGATGYVCYVGDLITSMGLGTTYNIQVEAISGTFQNGETVTGNSSGATIILTAGPGTVQLPSEGISVTQCEFVICNYGVYCHIPATATRPCVGIQVDNIHTNTLVRAFDFEYCFQTIIGQGLHYARDNNWGGVAMNFCDESQVSTDCRLDGLAYTGTFGVALANISAGHIDATINRCVTGLSVAATVVNTDLGCSFKSCSTEVSNAATVYPDAYGNMFHRANLSVSGYGGSYAAPGWGTPTGVIDRGTFDPATVTLENLARRVAGIIYDLKVKQRRFGA